MESLTPLQRVDLPIFRAIYGSFRSVPMDLIMALLSTSALGWLQLLIGFALVGSRRTKRYAGPHIFATVLTSTAPLFKNYVHHDRPSTMAFVHEQETFYSGSFPSGHTTVAFAIGILWTGILIRTGRRALAPLPLLWAVLAGISRIYRGVHWPSDVLGGALLGTLIAIALILFWPWPKTGDRRTGQSPPDLSPEALASGQTETPYSEGSEEGVSRRL